MKGESVLGFAKIPPLISVPILQAEEFLTSAQIEGILRFDGEQRNEVSSARKVLFCWSKPDHPKLTHPYHLFAKSFSSDLRKIENVQASAVEGYPNAEQWEEADLVVFYLTASDLADQQLAAMDVHFPRLR